MTIDREALRLSLIEYTCGQRCLGVAGNKGGCCTVGGRDFIIGPIGDVDAFLERLRGAGARGQAVERSSVFIEYEEGRQLFPDRPCWQAPQNYPALRISMSDALHPCLFYDAANARCGVYEIRPEVCRAYACDPLRHLLSLV